MTVRREAFLLGVRIFPFILKIGKVGYCFLHFSEVCFAGRSVNSADDAGEVNKHSHNRLDITFGCL